MEEQKEQTAKEPAAGAQPGFGKLLRSLREKAGLSLDDVANRTKISRGQLEAMEREEMRLLPEPVYVRAFIRDICRVMGADPKPVTDAFARDFAPEAPAAQAPAAADAVPARKMEKEVEFHASPRKKGFRVFLAFAVVIVLIGAVWGGWREGILSKLGGDNTEAAQVQMQEASGRTAALQRPRSPSNAPCAGRKPCLPHSWKNWINCLSSDETCSCPAITKGRLKPPFCCSFHHPELRSGNAFPCVVPIRQCAPLATCRFSRLSGFEEALPFSPPYQTQNTLVGIP